MSGGAGGAGRPRPLFPQTTLPDLLGGLKGVPRPAARQSLSSVGWVFVRVSSQLDMPREHTKGGDQGSSLPDGPPQLESLLEKWISHPVFKRLQLPCREHWFQSLVSTILFQSLPRVCDIVEGRIVDRPVYEELHVFTRSLCTTVQNSADSAPIHLLNSCSILPSLIFRFCIWNITVILFTWVQIWIW